MKKTIIALCAITVMVPYVTTLAWNGQGEIRAAAADGKYSGQKIESGRMVILDRDDGETAIDVEEYLIGMVARQIPGDYELETIKAQTILARTYICRQMGEGKEVMESALDVDWEEPERLDVDVYRRMYEAVQATKGVTATYEGNWIDPMFHRFSAGRTREGGSDHPYLQSVEAGDDLQCPDFRQEFSWPLQDAAALINSIHGAERGKTVAAADLPGSIQVVERDSAGYVTAIQVGPALYTGEEIQYALGLPSSYFEFGGGEGRLTCITKGSGHGYGFDQYGANEKAKNGWAAEELLKFYFKNIVLISE